MAPRVPGASALASGVAWSLKSGPDEGLREPRGATWTRSPERGHQRDRGRGGRDEEPAPERRAGGVRWHVTEAFSCPPSATQLRSDGNSFQGEGFAPSQATPTPIAHLNADGAASSGCDVVPQTENRVKHAAPTDKWNKRAARAVGSNPRHKQTRREWEARRTWPPCHPDDGWRTGLLNPASGSAWDSHPRGLLTTPRGRTGSGTQAGPRASLKRATTALAQLDFNPQSGVPR